MDIVVPVVDIVVPVVDIVVPVVDIVVPVVDIVVPLVDIVVPVVDIVVPVVDIVVPVVDIVVPVVVIAVPVVDIVVPVVDIVVPVVDIVVPVVDIVVPVVVVVVVTLIIAEIAVPNYINSRALTNKKLCINNEFHALLMHGNRTEATKIILPISFASPSSIIIQLYYDKLVVGFPCFLMSSYLCTLTSSYHETDNKATLLTHFMMPTESKNIKFNGKR